MYNFIDSFITTLCVAFPLIIGILFVKNEKFPSINYSLPGDAFPPAYNYEMLLVDPVKIPEPEAFVIPKGMQNKPVWQR